MRTNVRLQLTNSQGSGGDVAKYDAFGPHRGGAFRPFGNVHG